MMDGEKTRECKHDDFVYRGTKISRRYNKFFEI